MLTRSEKRPVWVIYATYDKQGRAPSFIADQLNAYAKLGLKILIVDTSPVLTDERRQLWESHAETWLQRDNTGYDFHSFRFGLGWILSHTGQEANAFSLLLTNDSCYGPFADLAPILALLQQDSTENCVHGMTESKQNWHHLQSYWLYFQPKALPTLIQFLEALPDLKDRREAIQQGELALSEYLRKQGVQLKAVCKLEEVLDRYVMRRKYWLIAELAVRRLLKKYRFNWEFDRECFNYLSGRQKELPAVNPTLIFGVDLMRDRLIPFVKRQLLRENPHHDPRVRAAVGIRPPDYFTNKEVLAALDRQ